MFVSNLVYIAGKRAVPLVTGVAAAKTEMLNSGTYDVYVSVDTFIRVAKANGMVSPDRPEDVTLTNGYRIAAGNTVPVYVPSGHCISAIAGETGAMIIHKID